MLKEWKREAPTLYKVLRATAMPLHYSHRKMQALRPVIGSAGAMLLKARNGKLSAVQHLVGLSLFLGRTRRKISTCICTMLQKYQVCIGLLISMYSYIHYKFIYFLSNFPVVFLMLSKVCNLVLSVSFHLLDCIDFQGVFLNPILSDYVTSKGHAVLLWTSEDCF